MSTKSELVLNFHITEVCNFSCQYCFAKWDVKYQDELRIDQNKIDQIINDLAEYFFSPNPLREAMRYQSVRLNFAGGEPMILKGGLVKAVQYARLRGFRTSLITNGFYLKDDIFQRLAPDLDILGISYDSANSSNAKAIGRIDPKGRWLSPEDLVQIADQYRQLNPFGELKINTVVNSVNILDDMNGLISRVSPDKWKLLQVLPVYGHDLNIQTDQYIQYVNRHQQHADKISLEDNSAMTQSYLMINPEGRFYQNKPVRGGYSYSRPISDVGVDVALNEVEFDIAGFLGRYSMIPLVQE